MKGNVNCEEGRLCIPEGRSWSINNSKSK